MTLNIMADFGGGGNDCSLFSARGGGGGGVGVCTFARRRIMGFSNRRYVGYFHKSVDQQATSLSI